MFSTNFNHSFRVVLNTQGTARAPQRSWRDMEGR